jgi:hypothetical protein
MFTRVRHERERRHWQPRLPAAVKAEGEPLAAHVDAEPDISSIADLSYISVDEVSEGIVTLLVSDWPELDERGRLRFSQSEPVPVDVGQATLEAVVEPRSQHSQLDPPARVRRYRRCARRGQGRVLQRGRDASLA